MLLCPVVLLPVISLLARLVSPAVQLEIATFGATADYKQNRFYKSALEKGLDVILRPARLRSRLPDIV